MRILIVEDETALREEVARRLRRDGFTVDESGDGDEGLYYATEFRPDVAVIDLGLPGLPGMDLIRRLRQDGYDFPILIFTARGRWEEKVDGLSAGADDYLVKPFHMEELVARVNALMRRSGGWSSPLLSSGPVTLDSRSQSVSLHDQPVELTAYEYRVLECLLLRSGEVISKSELTDRLYDQDFERDSNVIEVFIGRLRRKLDPDGELKPIETLRGRGYRWRLAREAG
ncbi:MAG: response regulator transcription factor [Gammaproteobacteria bacterium]